MNFVSMAAAGAVAVFGVMAAGAALAADLELRWIKADGTVVGERSLSTADIEALPQTTFTTNTPWTTAPTEFTGPELSELAKLGTGKAIQADVTALNDYTATIPAEDWLKHGATLAVRTNGELMKIRDKGPFWLMYPIDRDSKMLDTQLYHSRMVWQVQSVEFLVE